MTERRPYTLDTAAEHLGCSPSMVRKMCVTGKLRHFRIGRLIRIPATAMEELECASSGSEDRSTPIGEREDILSERHSVLRIVKPPIGG